MKIRVQEKGPLVRAVCTLPDGRSYSAVVSATPAAIAGELGPELGGRFLKKMGRGLKKAVLAPVKLAHKVTHSGPIEKMHKQVQGFVGKNLPIAKPFISIHNSLAKPVHKALAGKKVKAKVTAQGIAEVTKHLPPKQKAVAQSALVLRHKQDEALKDVAAKLAKEKVIKAAARAAKKNPLNKAARAVLAKANPKDAYRVIAPSGKTFTIPASKVH